MNSSDILRLARKAAEGRTANNETEARSLYGVDEEIARFAIYIEQAATAPLLARIAELEAELEKTKAIFAASCNHVAVMEMDRDAKRWRAIRQTMVAVDFEPEMGGSPVVMFELHAKTVRAGPEGADEIADAAMKGE